MKKAIIIALLLLFITPSLSHAVRVKGHWKDTNHDGLKDTWIEPYERTSPNKSRIDNYNYPGNYNPNQNK
jgi:hypothetical protein